MHSLLCLPMRVQKGLKPFRRTLIDRVIIGNGPRIVLALQCHRLSYVFQPKVFCDDEYNKKVLMNYIYSTAAEWSMHKDSYPFYSRKEYKL